MALYASYAGSRIVSARLTWPSWGLWTADVLLASDAAVAPSGPLVIGNLTLVGTVLPGRDGAFTGSRNVRLVGGAGGWSRAIGSRFYTKTQGVRLATIISDAAAEVGESVAFASPYSTRVVGIFWSRAAGQAVNVLGASIGRAWYIDDAGITQIGDRPTTAVRSPFDLTGPGYRGDLAQVTVATEDPFAWRPGALFRSDLLPRPLQAASTSLTMAPSGVLRVEALLS